MTDRKLHLDSVAVVALLACCAVWGLGQVAGKATLLEVPALMQAAIRSCAAAVLVALWARWRRIPLFDRDGTLAAGLWAGLLFAVEFGLDLHRPAFHHRLPHGRLRLPGAVRGRARHAADRAPRAPRPAAMRRSGGRIRRRGVGVRRRISAALRRGVAVGRRCAGRGRCGVLGRHHAGDPRQPAVAGIGREDVAVSAGGVRCRAGPGVVGHRRAVADAVDRDPGQRVGCSRWSWCALPATWCGSG